MLNKISIHIGLLMVALGLLGVSIWQYTRAISLYNRPAEIVYRCDEQTRQRSQATFLSGMQALRDAKAVDRNNIKSTAKNKEKTVTKKKKEAQN